MVSGDFFQALGVQPHTGRFFRPEEYATHGTHPVAVMGYSFWQQRFAGDPAIVGKTVAVNGHPFEIIGVSPPDFKGITVGLDTNLYVTFAMKEQAGPSLSSLDRRGSRFMQVTGRLKEGSTLESTLAAARVVGKRLEEEYPNTNQNCRPLLVPESESTLPPAFRGQAAAFSAALMVLVGLVLLIACVNVANLLLARAAARRREIGVRLALGAGRVRMIRQLLTESVLLATMGGAFGLALSWWATSLLSSYRIPVSIPVSLDFSLDQRVLGFTLAAALSTGLVFGLFPALQASRTELVPSLKGDEALSGRRRGFAFGKLLVVAQVALSLTLLVSAGLFLRSMSYAQQIDPGFRTEGIVLAHYDVSMHGYDRQRGESFFEQIAQRMRGLAGVEKVSFANDIPFDGFGGQQNGASVPGYQPAPGESMTIDYNIVTPGYFETMGIRLIAGRDFTQQDNRDGAGVIIVDEVFAKRFLGEGDPLGRTVNSSGSRTVVGLVAPTKLNTLGETAKPYMYYPMAQAYQPDMSILVRASGDLSQVSSQLRAESAALDPNLGVFQLRTMEDQVAFAYFPAQLSAALLGIFAGLAIVLSGAGLYGVVAYWVSQRTREIGIRLALGAERGRIVAMVLGQGLRLSAVGLAFGLIAALALTSFLGGFLFGLSTYDPITYVGVTLFLVLLAAAACAFPSIRALRVNPIQALRYD